MKLLAFLLLLPFVGWSQQPPACTWKATATVSGAQASFPNNTASPICNAFALSWNSTGFSGVTIELQGSDNNSSWTTFTGTSTVLVGTNPQTGLTGTIIIQASATLAHIRVNLTSLTGSGSVTYQIYGYNGVTPAAKTGGGGSGGTCAALGGDLSGTCTAATVVGLQGHAITGVQGNGALAQLSTGATITGDCTEFDANGNTVDAGAACGFPNPMSALGDMIYAGAGGTPQRLPGTNENNLLVLTQQGDGTNSSAPSWQVLPLVGSLAYYFTDTASDVATYLQQSLIPFSPKTTLAYTGITGTSTQTLQNFATNAGQPNVAFLPAGSYLFHVHASRTNFFTGSITLRCQFVEVDSSGVDIAVIGTSGVTPNLTGSEVEYIVEFNDPNVYTLASSASRIVARVQAVVAVTVSGTVDIYVGGEADSHITIPINGSVSGVNSVTGTAPIVITGTPTAPNVTCPGCGGVTSVFGNTGPTVGATGDIGATGTVLKLDTVPFCTGFTPTNSQFLQYTTGSSPNPCYTAAASSSGSGALTQIARTVLSSPTSSVTFSAIPGTYSGLQIWITATSSATTSFDNIVMQVNGDGAANYGWAYVNGNKGGSGAGGVNTGTANPPVFQMSISPGGFTLIPATGIISIPNYAATTLFKSATCNQTFSIDVSSADELTTAQFSWGWRSTAAITSIVLTSLNSDNFVTGSTFTLYGVQ